MPQQSRAGDWRRSGHVGAKHGHVARLRCRGTAHSTWKEFGWRALPTLTPRGCVRKWKRRRSSKEAPTCAWARASSAHEATRLAARRPFSMRQRKPRPRRLSKQRHSAVDERTMYRRARCTNVYKQFMHSLVDGAAAGRVAVMARDVLVVVVAGYIDDFGPPREPLEVPIVCNRIF